MAKVTTLFVLALAFLILSLEAADEAAAVRGQNRGREESSPSGRTIDGRVPLFPGGPRRVAGPGRPHNTRR